MYCSKCGAEVSGKKFCSKCGNNLMSNEVEKVVKPSPIKNKKVVIAAVSLLVLVGGTALYLNVNTANQTLEQKVKVKNKAKKIKAYPFKDNGQQGIINSKGKIVREGFADYISAFNQQGVAYYTQKEDDDYIYGLVNVDGETITSGSERISYTGMPGDGARTNLFSESGVISFASPDTTDSGNSEVGLMGSDGKIVKEPFTRMIGQWDFGGDTAIFISEDGLYGLLNDKGEILIEPMYDMLSFVSEGVYAAQTNSDKTVDLVTKKGEVLQGNISKDYVSSRNGYLIIKDEDDNYGVMNQHGKIVVEPFANSLTFSGYKDYLIYKTGENSPSGIIDVQGKKILKDDYYSISSINEAGNAIVTEYEGEDSQILNIKTGKGLSDISEENMSIIYGTNLFSYYDKADETNYIIKPDGTKLSEHIYYLPSQLMYQGFVLASSSPTYKEGTTVVISKDGKILAENVIYQTYNADQSLAVQTSSGEFKVFDENGKTILSNTIK